MVWSRDEGYVVVRSRPHARARAALEARVCATSGSSIRSIAAGGGLTQAGNDIHEVRACRWVLQEALFHERAELGALLVTIARKMKNSNKPVRGANRTQNAVLSSAKRAKAVARELVGQGRYAYKPLLKPCVWV